MGKERLTKLKFWDDSNKVHDIEVSDYLLAKLLVAIDQSMVRGILDRGITLTGYGANDPSKTISIKLMEAIILEEDYRRICMRMGKEIDLRTKGIFAN